MLIKIEDFRTTSHLKTRLETRLVNTRNICEVRILKITTPAGLEKWYAFELVYTFGHSSYFYFTQRKNFDWALKQILKGTR